MKSKRAALLKGLPTQYAGRSDGRRGKIAPEVLLERIHYALRNNYVVDEDGCHIWQGPVHESGYGNCGLTRPPGYSNRAHKLSWQVFVGPVPEGLLVCHECDKPLCIKLSHLWLGTNKENTQDMLAKGRR